MDEKHTPGPWGRQPESTNIDPLAAPRNAGTVYGDGWHLALVFADGSIGEKTGEANARLIAAAPELLEALQATLRMLEAAHRQLGMHSPDNKRVQAAHAALKKALGA